ncbi:hypothetical protein CVT25_001827 [Psilocybe cyanescens]|uniref:Fungal N-terminal domain-containing protein n=1 Tax=Psilocybe cyanescens TaxID=93625 RepID=A0A409WQC9_PSICY|nr:hypothetical protein CVT25_001827 [Psilocybe cyanescens]
MEVISAATTVCALCMSIVQWIDQLAQKEELFVQISSSVRQIHQILMPFSSATFKGTGEIELSQAIRSVGDALQRTKEHLVVWKYKRSQRIIAFINPGAQIQKLQDDQKHINNQLIVLLTAIAAVGYIRDHAKDSTSNSLSDLTESPSISDASTNTLVPLEEMGEGDAKTFWKDFIGIKVNFVTVDIFALRLQSWYNEFNESLPKKTCDRIIMRLDEFNCGGITPYNLARALEGATLKQFVDRYMKGLKPSSLPKSEIITTPGRGLRTPLLVWIDDTPDNNAYEASQARLLGIMVIELSSTAIAKAWVEANLDFLREIDHPSSLRFISDNVRLETNPREGLFLNQTAGQNFLQYLRARFFEAPVLIYTGLSIGSTTYVNSYEAAGSTTDIRTVLRYITSLGAGHGEDNLWKGFKGAV